MKEKFFDWVIRLRVPIMVIFLAAAVWGTYGKALISVNYDMNDYLPQESPSTVSLEKMTEEFDGAIPNARVAVKDVSYAEALSYKEKLEHRPFLPPFKKFGRLINRITVPLAVAFCLMMIPAYRLSNQNSYYYGSSHIFGEGTQYGDDTAFIEDTFGIKDTYVLMVPRGNDKTERKLCSALNDLGGVTSITSYTEILGPTIPESILPEKLLSKLRSENYSRLVLSVCAEYEGDETFALVEDIRNLAREYYGEDYYLAGQGVSTYDLMDTITADMVKVNLIAIGAVFLILLVMMKKFITPVVLVLTIETAIWINLSIPCLQHKPLFYIAYLIISSVQLGATVDYAILFSDRYGQYRQTMEKKEAICETISKTTVFMLTSGCTMITVGFLLGIISTHGLLSQLGYLLGKGTICSLLSVLFVLPGMLYLTELPRRRQRQARLPQS